MIGLPNGCPTGATHKRTPLPAEVIWKAYVSLKLAVSVPVHSADQLSGPTEANPGSVEPPGSALPSVQDESTRSSHRVIDGVPDRVELL
jgi:hypothetical protein